MDCQYTNELTPAILAITDQSSSTAEQLAGMNDIDTLFPHSFIVDEIKNKTISVFLTTGHRLFSVRDE
ncbi:hypothetical protein [Erwinia sorbitola]|uniref:Uncharacterized protein n=1 Tax=Erwinia sorbitola TaxID=2681984 RepID=A0A6I6EIU3_9GAMM|nr:hypothetical protein [Erwinia sorbitola]QGU87905.1 hypothetical protein GN242_12005 [Erwinia sorbitola]